MLQDVIALLGIANPQLALAWQGGGLPSEQAGSPMRLFSSTTNDEWFAPAAGLLNQEFAKRLSMPDGSSPAMRSGSKVEWSTAIVPAARSHAMREPCSWKNVTSFSTSVISGTFSSATGSSVSRVAHKMGRTEFLLPEGVMVPERGLPPLTMRSATVEVEVERREQRLPRAPGRKIKRRPWNTDAFEMRAVQRARQGLT